MSWRRTTEASTTEKNRPAEQAFGRTSQSFRVLTEAASAGAEAAPTAHPAQASGSHTSSSGSDSAPSRGSASSSSIVTFPSVLGAFFGFGFRFGSASSLVLFIRGFLSSSFPPSGLGASSFPFSVLSLSLPASFLSFVRLVAGLSLHTHGLSVG